MGEFFVALAFLAGLALISIFVLFLLGCVALFMTAPPAQSLHKEVPAVEMFKYQSQSRVGKAKIGEKEYYFWSDDVATGVVMMEVE